MDRLTEMEAFVTVVDQGGFTDAAKKWGSQNLRFQSMYPALKPGWARGF